MLAPNPILHDPSSPLGDEAPGYFSIFTLTPISAGWVAATSPAKAARIAVRSGRERDTYFGIGPHGVAPREYERGTADGVIALPGLLADHYVKGEAHRASNLPPTGTDTMRIAEAILLSQRHAGRILSRLKRRAS